MARENQGLQIALIVFVMLTIILGVTTFLFYQQYTDANQRAESAQQEAAKQRTAAQTIQGANNRLMEILGFATTMKMDEIEAEFVKDMETYASAFPEDARFYHPVLEYLSKAVHDRNIELVDLKTENETLKVRYQEREQAMLPQIAQYAKAQQEAAADLTARSAAFKTDRDRFVKEQADTKAALDKLQASASEKETAFRQKLATVTTSMTKLAQVNAKHTRDLQNLKKDTFDVPDGQITWVNPQGGTVYLDLGRADALTQQVTFAIYPMDTTNLTRGGKKASVEVTRILGEHLAEARVLDEDVANPILPGDKVHTPIWTAGQKRHFALAGFMDIDDDGNSDQSLIHNLITMNGGVVDCETDATGNMKGSMSANTRYIVLGEAPNEKGQAGTIEGYTAMRDEADRLGIQKITLGELLQKMGWKKPTQVVRFGRDANPKDFRPKAEGDVPRVSSGTVSGLFQPRRPPGGSGGAY